MTYPFPNCLENDVLSSDVARVGVTRCGNS